MLGTFLVNPMKGAHWQKGYKVAVRLRNRLVDIRKRMALRLRAWWHPVVEIEGVRLYRGSGLAIPVLEALESGVYERPEARLVRHAIQPDDIVLELGAGLGFIASLCAKTVGDNRVHTYEANPVLEPIIMRNFSLNGVGPRLEMSVLGEDSGAITFYVMREFWISSTIRRSGAKPIEVPMKRFNDELSRLRPSFLIIDIEGGEHEFIRYARLDGVRKVCIELHPEIIGPAAMAEVEAFFASQGFSADSARSDRRYKLYLREPGV